MSLEIRSDFKERRFTCRRAERTEIGPEPVASSSEGEYDWDEYGYPNHNTLYKHQTKGVY